MDSENQNHFDQHKLPEMFANSSFGLDYIYDTFINFIIQFLKYLFFI
jgi:hypothetical protein